MKRTLIRIEQNGRLVFRSVIPSGFDLRIDLYGMSMRAPGFSSGGSQYSSPSPRKYDVVEVDPWTSFDIGLPE